MSTHPTKTYPTIGCCGIDCGLCPRYYTSGSSRCPGCCGPDFFNKHPSCSHITCCVKKRNLEVCADCIEFPCLKFEGWDTGDSFVTHLKSVTNLKLISEQGLEAFVAQQRKRMELLETMLTDFDEGRSKSFYCIAATLLRIAALQAALKGTEQKMKANERESWDIKAKSKILRNLLSYMAAREGIELKLRSK